MFFFASKILGFVITPVMWIFSLLLYALLVKRTDKKRKLLIVAIALIYFFSNSFILEEVNRAWEVPATPYNALSVYEAGIVLGGMLDYDVELDRIQFHRGSDRLFQAVELYKRGYIKRIFFVGGSGSIEFADLKEGVLVNRFLLDLGIPKDDIWIENESRNTQENAVNAKKILQAHAVDSVNLLLITSAAHMRRSMACFEKLGVSVQPYSVDRYAGPVRRFTLDHLLIPNVNALMLWNPLIHEWVGMVMYKVKGYI